MKKLVGFLVVSLLVLISIQSLVTAQTFTKGDIVEVYNMGGVGLKIRATPCGTQTGNKSDGSIGLILEGPVYCVLQGTGYNWWRIRWSDGLEGWSAENWLRRMPLPAITSASPSPNVVSPGGTVNLAYSMTNPGREIGGAIAPLLGASIQPSGGGNYLSDPANNRKATIPSGSSSVSRSFVVPATATPGTYDLLVSLVVDVNNNGQIDSNDRAWDLKRFSGVLQVRVPVVLPTVETMGATDITPTAATINARITNDGGSAIIERRFDWGTNPNGLDQWTANVTVSGNSFSYRLTGLAAQHDLLLPRLGQE